MGWEGGGVLTYKKIEMKRRDARSTDSTIKINIYKINTAGIDFFFKWQTKITYKMSLNLWIFQN